jgi:hypothetical protein
LPPIKTEIKTQWDNSHLKKTVQKGRRINREWDKHRLRKLIPDTMEM